MALTIPSNAFGLPAGAQTPWDPLPLPSSSTMFPPTTGQTAYGGSGVNSISAGTSAMPFPLLAMLAVQGGASLFGALAAKSAQDRATKAATEQNLLTSRLQESQLNPFRAARSQTGYLEDLDRSMHTTQPSQTAPGAESRYGSYNPGSYSMSPEMIQWLAEMQRRVAAGQGANALITPGMPSNSVGNLTTAYGGPPRPAAVPRLPGQRG